MHSFPYSLTRGARVWWRRLLFAMACLQVCLPSVAAVADGWRLDERTPYAHVEEQGATGCVVVHDGDCLLCAIATSDPIRPSCLMPLLDTAATSQRPQSALVVVEHDTQRRESSSRAPPIGIG